MISFSQKIKSELLLRDTPAFCCAVSELLSYILVSGKDNGEYISISGDNEAVLESVSKLAGKVLKVNAKPLKLGNTYSIMIPKGKKYKEKYSALENLYDGLIADMFKKDCCRAGFIKGIFISSGTITDPEKNYNLEFYFKNEILARMVEKVFSALNLELKETKRKSNYVLYTKNSNTICDFLTRIGAHNEQMQILNLKIERELRCDFNRAVNSEIANMDKTIKASIKQITAIEKIKQEKGLEILPEELYEVAKLRLEYRDLSIGALALKLKNPITKSGLNHLLYKIMKIADSI